MRIIINCALIALFLMSAMTPGVAAEDLFEKISAEALYEAGAEIYHSAFLYLHADKTLDLENEDAVLLFERLETRWTEDGRLVQTTRRSVLIRTEYGLDHFADLRIPWDSTRQKLTVERMRTLRASDEATIDAGPTAVVETLPYAVDRAPDYCHLRETMLLHDGIDLPCILETIWTIEDTESYRPGASGTHSLMGTEPAIISQFALTLPAGLQPSIEVAGGAPSPTVTTDDTGSRTWTVAMKDLSARPLPETNESYLQQPRVSWSTWTDWDTLATDLETRLDANAVIDDDLRTALNEKLEEARTPAEKARLIADFIDQTTRLVGYGSSWWPEPRPAHRTWATGYGNRVDRTVLAAALYREAGFKPHLAFRSMGFGDTEINSPGLNWSDGASLLVSGQGVAGWFDPGSARFSAGTLVQYDHTVWVPGESRQPTFRGTHPRNRMTVRFDLAHDAEKKVWAGTGVLESQGAFSPFSKMSGLGSETRDWLTGFVGSLLATSTIKDWNPEQFGSDMVTLGFALELPAGERDEQGRLVLQVGSFPDAPHLSLHAETRDSDIHLPGPMVLQVELHLETGKLETVHLPPAVQLKNRVGQWQVETREKEDEVVLIRRLELDKGHYPAIRWPELRALLLARQSRAGRLIYFKP